jgi:hypothetical protein
MPILQIPLAQQTAYANLVDRASAAAFYDAFAEDGVFTPKTVRGRRYWYFQLRTKERQRRQMYVGPETPDLLERIRRHKDAREDQRDRQALVSTLVRSANLPRPPPPIGDVIAALANAGVFRLRGVLVGTVAYQTYPAMLGVRLPAAAIQTTMQTEDIDIAQFADISVAVGDNTPPIIEVLQNVDKSFRPIQHSHDPRRVATYEASNGVRVDFLTPKKGRDTDEPKSLPAFGTDAQQLRFLDFLIYDPESAVVLYGEGIYVMVPSPQRYAVHKLIVARRRPPGAAKSNKDIRQAEALLETLAKSRSQELRGAWNEAYGRGATWRQLLGEGLGLTSSGVRDATLKVVGTTRSIIIPKLELSFASSVARYDFNRDVVTFLGEAGGALVRCAISREALEDHFDADNLSKEARLEKFRENRDTIERLAQRKYLFWPVEDVAIVLIKTMDVEKLRQEIKTSAKRKR